MLVSPFTIYRGAAKIMAEDLRNPSRAGLDAQLCGDAHLSNFGVFASPERLLLFDLNDFDETLPGPFEYDVLRMTASFTIAARNNGFSASDARDVTLTAVRSYREAMARFATMGVMEIWCARLSEVELRAAFQLAVGTQKGKAQRKAVEALGKNTRRNIAKARSRDSLQALSKLAEYVDGQYRIVSQPPIVIPARELLDRFGMSPDETRDALRSQLRSYRSTLQDDRRHLLEQFQFVDMARKVVGVGSIGTRSFILLLEGRDEQDPLFLQVKEATASVLEDHGGAGRAGPADDAGRQRHPPGLDEGHSGQPLPVLAAAARHEGVGGDRGHAAAQDVHVRPCLRLDARPGARPLGRSHRDGGLPRQQRQVRQVCRRLLRALRRPERRRLRPLRGGGAGGRLQAVDGV
jgi:hypothetical protein